MYLIETIVFVIWKRKGRVDICNEHDEDDWRFEKIIGRRERGMDRKWQMNENGGKVHWKRYKIGSN